MPLYEYECKQCHHHLEKIQHFNAPPEKVCPECGGELERVITAPAFQFKGSGWYVNDYAKSGSTASSSTETAGKSESKSASSTTDSGKSESGSKSDAPATASTHSNAVASAGNSASSGSSSSGSGGGKSD